MTSCRYFIVRFPRKLEMGSFKNPDWFSTPKILATVDAAIRADGSPIGRSTFKLLSSEGVTFDALK